MTDPRERPDDRTALDELDRDECFRLLSTMPIGRLAVCTSGQAPLVVPVNFGLDGDVVVFRSDQGTTLQALQRGPVTFECDAIDPYHRIGWSVLVHGVLAQATTEQVDRVCVEPWAPGPKSQWIQLSPATVTGRRLRLLDVPEDRPGYL